MLKKISIVFICFLMAFCVGCGEKEVSVDSSTVSSTSSKDKPIEKPVYYTNLLTGEKNLSEEVAKNRPVAIMVNNISIAQAVQTGVNKADIVYETEVEGGITRLMAVFQNVGAVGRIGTIRSARYVYVDLALGHNAVYLHCGQDPVYCAPHLKDIEHYTVDTGNIGKRISNGLASEHTLYTEGNKVYNTFVKGKTVKNSNTWQKFADEKTEVKLTGGAATKINVPFSTSYNTGFDYDATAGKYVRSFRGKTNKDYVTGETTTVKNVFVLLTPISKYSDNYHMNVSLQGGNGYYFVNGTYTPIKWSKGAANNSFKFTNVDGSELTVNQGNSWVCIANSSIHVGIQ
ncbi:MAG: DUF3048 domain-containing protein [Ruminococcaceae bacterium]|nr:DUF3048 domain-containing protein [Oscillospiraceae bacterium]